MSICILMDIFDGLQITTCTKQQVKIKNIKQRHTGTVYNLSYLGTSKYGTVYTTFMTRLASCWTVVEETYLVMFVPRLWCSTDLNNQYQAMNC